MTKLEDTLKPYQRDMLRLIKERAEPKILMELPRDPGKLRPTQSPALNFQMIGRANRPVKKPDVFFIDEAHYFKDKK